MVVKCNDGAAGTQPQPADETRKLVREAVERRYTLPA
jgi:hypothetical protein